MPRGGRRPKAGGDEASSASPSADAPSQPTTAPETSSSSAPSLPSIKLRLPKLGQRSGIAPVASNGAATASSELSELPSSSATPQQQGTPARADDDDDGDEDMADVTQARASPQRSRRLATRAKDESPSAEAEDATPSPGKRGSRRGAARKQSIGAASAASPSKRRARGAKLEEDDEEEDAEEDQYGSQGTGDGDDDGAEDDEQDDDGGDDAQGSKPKAQWVIQIESGQSALVHRAVAKIPARNRVGRMKGAAGRNKSEPAADAEEAAGDSTPSGEEPVPPQEEYDVIINKEKAIMKGEEVVMDEDEQGNTKIDENGELLGGRKYKCATFSSPFRSNPKLLFAPAIECARSLGYKDSLHFFRTNLRLVKITLTQREKDHLIESGKYSTMVRGRNVTVVAMRNVFKIFGHKAVQGGRFVTDDYYEAQAREKYAAKEGQRHADVPAEAPQAQAEASSTAAATPAAATTATVTELPIPGPIGAFGVPTTSRDVSGKRRDRNAQAAARRNLEPAVVVTHDANGETIITTFGDAGYAPSSRIAGQQRKRRELESEGVSDENWMLEMARSVRGLNAEVAQARRERATVFPPSTRSGGNGLGPVGWYEPATGSAHFSTATQPTRASFEKVYPRPLLDPVGLGTSKRATTTTTTKGDTSVEDETMDGGATEDGESEADVPTHLTPAQIEAAKQRVLFDAQRQAPVLGGTKVGARAYGVATFEERVLPPATLKDMGLGEVRGVKRRRKEGVEGI